MSKNRDTLIGAIIAIGAEANAASKQMNYFAKSVQEVRTKKRFCHIHLYFTVAPDHKVSQATIQQLKSILRGRSAISPKKPGISKRFAKKTAKQYSTPAGLATIQNSKSMMERKDNE